MSYISVGSPCPYVWVRLLPESLFTLSRLPELV